MKNLILIFILISCSLLLAATTNSTSVPQTTPFKVIQQSSQFLDVEFTLPSYQLETKTVDGIDFKKIVTKDSGQLLQPGMPDVPNYSINIAIPYHGSVTTEILGIENNRLQNFIPYPQQDESTAAPSSFRMNRSYYETGSLYPQQKIQASDPEILREIRIVNVTINPFSYDARTKSLNVDQKIQVRFHFTSTRGVNEMEAPISISPSFEPLYRAQILNYGSTRDVTAAYTQERILMIYPYTTDSTFLTRLYNLIDWKKQKGYLVSSRMLPSSPTPTNTSVKTIIQAAYDSVSVRPTYLILIGDATGTFTIPTWSTSAWSTSNDCDYQYTLLAGSDLLGDMLIGRISISSTNDFLNMTKKGFLYERDLDIASASWLNRLLLVGDTSSSGISTIYTNKFIKEIAAIHNPSYSFLETYAAPFPSSIDTGFTTGVGFFNYRGYIGMSSWSPTSSSMLNGNKVPHAVIITCATGTFNGSTSTTESLTRLGLEASPKGSVTAIGMATSSTHTMLNNCLDGGIFDGIYNYDMHTMGQALLNGKLYLHRIYHAQDPDITEFFMNICNLIGDPTVEVFTGIPDTLSVRASISVPSGSNQVEITVNDASANPVPNAIVTCYTRGAVHVTGLTDSYGKYIAMIPTTLTGSFTVTVSKQNFKPNVKTVSIGAAGGLVYSSQSIDDNNVAPSVGNSNGVANAGETIELQLAVKNTTTSQLNLISGVLSTTSTGVTILTPNVSYGNIAAGAIANGATKYLFSIAQNIPDNTMLNFKLNCSDSGTGRYSFSFQVLARSGDMDITNVNISDSGNGVLDPGETTNLILTIQNNGQIPTNTVYAQLIPLNSLVTVSDDIAYFGTVNNGSTATCTSNPFTITGNSILVPGMVIPMNVNFYNSLGYSETEPITLNIGVVDIADPTGPDAFGHVIYDTGDISYAVAPTYSWIEIATPEGGLGTLVPVTDVGVPLTTDEGDQTGSNSITTVILPFTFRLYGRNYTEASICSNGFISLGASTDGEFRNYTLPGALGPNPMIAAFWDDLSLPTGSGVYQYYDSSLHYWVVEWYQAKNGYNQTSEETFQAILYDPFYYPTSNGEGNIKLQYKVFNNVDAGSTVYPPTHGCYATIGIKDHTGTDGIQYSFNRTYPSTADSLVNLKALLITSAPEFHSSAYLTTSDKTLLDGNNSIIEPNEDVQIGISLSNIGMQAGHNISATLSSTDPYISITTPTVSYSNLDPDQSAWGLSYFQVHIASGCPNNYSILVTLNISCTEGTFQKVFSINVVKPGLYYDNYFINDQGGNNNGIPNSNESILLVVNTNNTSSIDVSNVNMTMSTTSPNVTLLDTSLACGTSAASTKLQKAFRVNLGTITNGTVVSFNLAITGTSMTTVNQVIQMTIGTSGMTTDFESNNGSFSSTSGWAWGLTSKITENTTHLWGTDLTSNYPDNTTWELFSPVIPIGTGATLSFWHLFCTEANYDGGVVYISTDAGTNWTLISPTGGYPNSSTNLAIHPAYSSASTGVAVTGTATFDLSSYAGNNVMFKWHFFSDISLNNKGWFIDNVVISGVVTKTGKITGTITLSPTSPTITNTVVKASVYATHPASDGTYSIYLPNGTYSTIATLTNYTTPSTQSKTVSDVNPTQTANFTLELLVTPPTLSCTPAVGSIALNWSARDDRSLHFDHYNVWRKINADYYRKITEVAGTSYSDTPTINGSYSYQVTTVYTEGESSPSNTVTFNYPPPTPPNPVTLVSPANTATGITLLPTVSWTDNDRTGVKPLRSRSLTSTPNERSLSILINREPATDYYVYCDTNTDPTTLVGSPTASPYTFTTSLAYSTTYYWKVVAHNAYGTSTENSIRSFTTMADPTPPNPVTLVAPTAGATGQIILPQVSWTPAGTGTTPTVYYVYCDTNADPTTLVGSPTASPFTFTTPLAYSTTYKWKVVAHNANGNSTGNTVRSFTTMADPTPPNPVTLVAPTAGATGQIILPQVSWTPAGTGTTPTVYYVYCDTNTDPTTLVGSPTASPFTFTTPLAYSTTYKWKVVAHNANGNSTGNTVRSFTTMADPTPPNPVTLVAPTAGATGQIILPQVSWTPAGTGTTPTVYYVYCDTNTDPTTLVGSPTASPFTFTTPLAYSTTYKWKVVAHNANGNSTSNTVRSFSTMADPTPPNPVTLVAPTAGATGQIILPQVSWTPAGTGTTPTVYYVYCDTNTDPTTLVGSPTASPFTFTTPLAYSTTYKWKVVAHNANGNSTGNTVRSFTTMADPTPPNPVTLVAPTAGATGQIILPQVSWTPAGTGTTPTVYYVYCDTNTDPTTLVGSPTASPFTFTTPLAYSTTYKWKVVAHNANGNSTSNTVRSFTTMADPTPPNPVTLVSPSDSASTVISMPTLRWSPAAAGTPATVYYVYCDTNADPTTLVGSPTDSSFAFTSPLSYATTYYWKVVAHNVNGNSTSNSIRSFTTLPDQTQLQAPDNVTAIKTESGIEVSWDTVLGATTYNIYAVTDPTVTEWGSPIATIDATTTTWVDTSGLDYRFYHVTANNTSK